MNFKIEHIPEPKLMFMNGTALNPVIGLIKNSPRFSSVEEKEHKWLKIGIIGTSKSISDVLFLFDEMRYVISPKKITKWRLPFIGLFKESALKFSISTPSNWQQKITFD